MQMVDVKRIDKFVVDAHLRYFLRFFLIFSLVNGTIDVQLSRRHHNMSTKWRCTNSAARLDDDRAVTIVSEKLVSIASVPIEGMHSAVAVLAMVPWWNGRHLRMEHGKFPIFKFMTDNLSTGAKWLTIISTNIKRSFIVIVYLAVERGLGIGDWQRCLSLVVSLWNCILWPYFFSAKNIRMPTEGNEFFFLFQTFLLTEKCDKFNVPFDTYHRKSNSNKAKQTNGPNGNFSVDRNSSFYFLWCRRVVIKPVRFLLSRRPPAMIGHNRVDSRHCINQRINDAHRSGLDEFWIVFGIVARLLCVGFVCAFSTENNEMANSGDIKPKDNSGLTALACDREVDAKHLVPIGANCLTLQFQFPISA